MNWQTFFLFLTPTCFSLSTALAESAAPGSTKLSKVLSSFMQHEDGAFRYQLLSQEEDPARSLNVETYQMDSQKWPVFEDADIPTTVWSHRLRLFIPRGTRNANVLLYVGGGYNRDKEGKTESFDAPKEQLDYALIASVTQSVVAELQDVPNQFLYMNGEWKREDQFMAFTYKKVMQNPLKNAFLAGHLPMAKSIVKAMDLIQTRMREVSKDQDTRFVLAGASKRGWAVWLAALEDPRVDAIIPIVIDVLNVQKSMNHICVRYKGCPYSFKDYEAENLTHKLNSQAFADLMKIEDPFQYLGLDYDAKYKERMSIPKMIINASGDDFFVPDSSHWYFKALPGSQNYIRYMPNALHYFRGNPISDATQSLAMIQQSVLSFFALHGKGVSLPKVEWDLKPDVIEVRSSVLPSRIRLWTAFNEEAPDFRYINKHSSWHFLKKKLMSYFPSIFGELCDTCYKSQDLSILSDSKNGLVYEVKLPIRPGTWRASFVELHYQVADHEFIVTSEVSLGFTGNAAEGKDLRR